MRATKKAAIQRVTMYNCLAEWRLLWNSVADVLGVRLSGSRLQRQYTNANANTEIVL